MLIYIIMCMVVGWSRFLLHYMLGDILLLKFYCIVKSLHIDIIFFLKHNNITGN